MEATPEVVALVFPVNPFMNSINTYTGQFSPVLAVGVGAALALVILAAFAWLILRGVNAD